MARHQFYEKLFLFQMMKSGNKSDSNFLKLFQFITFVIKIKNLVLLAISFIGYPGSLPLWVPTQFTQLSPLNCLSPYNVSLNHTPANKNHSNTLTSNNMQFSLFLMVPVGHHSKLRQSCSFHVKLEFLFSPRELAINFVFIRPHKPRMARFRVIMHWHASSRQLRGGLMGSEFINSFIYGSDKIARTFQNFSVYFN